MGNGRWPRPSSGSGGSRIGVMNGGLDLARVSSSCPGPLVRLDHLGSSPGDNPSNAADYTTPSRRVVGPAREPRQPGPRYRLCPAGAGRSRIGMVVGRAATMATPLDKGRPRPCTQEFRTVRPTDRPTVGVDGPTSTACHEVPYTANSIWRSDLNRPRFRLSSFWTSCTRSAASCCLALL